MMGWRLMRHPTFDATTPGGVAHDLVEHHPSDRGTVLEEVAAMGAFVYVEIQSGYYHERYNPRYSVAEVLADSFISVVRSSRWTSGTLPAIPEKSALSLPLDDHEVDDIFLDVPKAMEKNWDAEFNDPDFTFDAIARPRWPLMLQALRKGYRYARQRYESPEQSANLLQNIEEVSKRAASCVEQGDEMVIHYETRGTLVHATLGRNGFIYDTVGRRWH